MALLPLGRVLFGRRRQGLLLMAQHGVDILMLLLQLQFGLQGHRLTLAWAAAEEARALLCRLSCWPEIDQLCANSRQPACAGLETNLKCPNNCPERGALVLRRA